MLNKLQKNIQIIFPISTIIGLIIGRLAGILDTILDNPYPVIIFDIEMHHFYYGLFLLCILLPFFAILEKKKLILFLIGIGFGVMLDGNLAIYNIVYPYIFSNFIFQYIQKVKFIK